jgi:ABC-type branched-subunit amino acid transport system substrate-binding protein
MERRLMAEQSHARQARRSILGLAAAALLALGLGACQIVPVPDVAATPPPQEQAPPPREAEPDPVVPGLPADERRNRVAVLVPTTGTNAGVGNSIANAANLALLDAGGERIRITVYDTARGGAAAAANEALAEGNGLFLGPLLADDVRAVAPIARRAGVPVIAFSNDVSVAGDGVYVMGFTPGQSVTRVVSYARAQGVERFGGLAPEGVYGNRAGQALVEAVREEGGRLVGLQQFGRTAAALRTAVTRLSTQGAYDAVLIADGGRAAGGAATLIRGGPSAGARILGTELWATETDLGTTASLRGGWYAAASDTMFNQLRTRYRARFGGNPYRLASLGYDSVLLAVRTAKDWPIGRAFPIRLLADPGGFTGIDGAFRFGEDGVVERALEVREVTATGTRIVSSAPRGFD